MRELQNVLASLAVRSPRRGVVPPSALGPQFGESRPFPLNVAARCGKLRLDARRRRQHRERALRFVTPSHRLLAARAQSRLGLAQRGKARGVAARLAFGFGVPIARRLRFLLQRAPARARVGFGRCRGGGFGLGGRNRRLFVLDLAAHRLELGLDIGEPVLAGEAPRGAGRRVGRDREAVPAPEVALARDEPLPWFEQWDEARSRFAVDHADLRKTAPQLLRRIDVIAERFDSIR